MTGYFEVTDRDCAARIGRLMLDQRIRIAQEASGQHHLLLNGESPKDMGILGAARHTY